MREMIVLVAGGGSYIHLESRDPVGYYAMDMILAGSWRIGRILVPKSKPCWFSPFSSGEDERVRVAACW